ncbi:MAG: hypothetical protein ACJ79Y_13100, partial [Myxococcales bacterium]
MGAAGPERGQAGFGMLVTGQPSSSPGRGENAAGTTVPAATFAAAAASRAVAAAWAAAAVSRGLAAVGAGAPEAGCDGPAEAPGPSDELATGTAGVCATGALR